MGLQFVGQDIAVDFDIVTKLVAQLTKVDPENDTLISYAEF